MDEVPQIALGSALFSLIEPQPGHAREFNRWYERDHFYAGCMIGANVFSGRRWVATRALKALRWPVQQPLYPAGSGSLLALYWILRGTHAATVDWAVAQVNGLHAQQRMDKARENIYSAFLQHLWSAERDTDGVPPELALEHPFPGLGVFVVERDARADAGAFEARARDALLPGWLQDSSTALVVCLKPEPLPAGSPGNVPRADAVAEALRYVWLAFLDADPAPGWSERVAALDASLAHGEGRLGWAAPFIPTVPGTDRFMDEL